MRITVYTVGRMFHYGQWRASYRRSRAEPLVIDDTFSRHAA
jgi:hypothetical protein